MFFSDNFVLLYICLYSRALCWEILGFIPALMLGSAKIATVAYSSLNCLYSRHTKKQQLLILAYSALFWNFFRRIFFSMKYSTEFQKKN